MKTNVRKRPFDEWQSIASRGTHCDASNHRCKVNPALPELTDSLQPLSQSSIGLTGFSLCDTSDSPVGNARSLQDNCKLKTFFLILQTFTQLFLKNLISLGFFCLSFVIGSFIIKERCQIMIRYLSFLFLQNVSATSD